MSRIQQVMENVQVEDFSEKIEKAKQIYCLLNDITFGNEREAAISRLRLNKIK